LFFEDVKKIILEDEEYYKILIKAALVIGIHGLLRRIEITELFFEDVEKIILEDDSLKNQKPIYPLKGFILL
jgi:hypothetical protein